MAWSWGVRGDPLLVCKHRDPRLRALLVRAMHEFAPDVVMIEMAVMAQYLRSVRTTPTILTDHEAGIPDTTTGLGAFADRRDRHLWMRYVRRHYPMASAVQALTDEDAATLAALVGRPVRRRGPVLDLPDRPAEPGRNPPRVLFLGDYLHRPNPEAAAILAREVLPVLRAALPAAELWLAGANQDRLGGNLGSLPGVRLCGYVPDLAGLLGQVRLVLSPLFSGGGFRMKSMAALAHGVPVVTNSLGARGVAAPAAARLVADSLPDLAAAALSWLRSPAAAAAAGAAGYQWAREHLSADRLARQQIELAKTLLRAARPGA
jgi:glycosyltransferase involved in cell wall biosynthesis